MSLSFAAVVPHTPMLIPAIGKEKVDQLKATVDALTQLEQDLYLAKPEIIVIISPHGGLFDDSFSINAHTHYNSCFDEFGDFDTKKEWKGTPDLAAKISHEAHLRNINVRLVSNEKLDHGSCVPLYFLTQHLPDIKVLPVGFSGLPREDHMAFGALLKDIIMQQDKRVAVIASGDLSHKLSPESPEGFDPHARDFDEQLIQLLERNDVPGVVGMDLNVVNGASACGYRSVLILLGILQEMDLKFKKYSYESPFGVGYLTGNFAF